MKADTTHIHELITSETILRIPFFQRRYVWEKDDWERFANDMENIPNSEREYFLGAIILKKEKLTEEEENGDIMAKWLVVDGQQRLTTLALYMKVLYAKASKTNDFFLQYLQKSGLREPVIVHSHEDKRVFNQILTQGSLIESDADGNIAQAYNYFLEHLNEKESEINLSNLLNAIKRKVRFVVIWLDEHDDEQQIFDTINSLGVPLTTAELMKNFLYEADDQQAYEEHWKPMFDENAAQKFWGTDAAKARQAKGKDTLTIERFFHAFVRVKMWDFKDSKEFTEIRRKMFVKTENVFSTCKSFVEVFGMDKQDLAAEIIEYARLFKKYLSADILNMQVKRNVGIQRISCIINAMDATAITPYVLYVLYNVKDEAERNAIFKYMESYLMRRYLTPSQNKNYSDLFSENLIGQRIDSAQKLRAYIEGKDDTLTLAMPKDQTILANSCTAQYTEKTATLVYYLFETSLNNADNRLEGFKACIAKQLMPKTSDNWPKFSNPDEEEERKKLASTIGNFFLVDDEKIVKKVEKKAFADKFPVFQSAGDAYSSSKQKLNPQSLGSHPLGKWDVDDIKDRGRQMVGYLINSLWPE